MQEDSILIWDDPPSSPFMTEVADTSRKSSKTAQHEPRATKSDQSPFDAGRIFSRGSPDANKENYQPMNASDQFHAQSPHKTPLSARLAATPGTTRTAAHEQSISSSVLREPQSATKSHIRPRGSPACEIEAQSPSRPEATLDTAHRQHGMANAANEPEVDDTCFSTFSVIPELTVFANLRQASPAKSRICDNTSQADDATPRPCRKRASSSQTPPPSTARRQKSSPPDEGMTSLLIDFTSQFDALPQGSPQRMRIPGLTPSRTESNLSSYLSSQRKPPMHRQSLMSPSKTQSNLLNLLDFELPPPPTPKSAPQFSAREVESIESGLQSQIGSLSARLAGREAELESLKKALEDAERRVSRAEEGARLERERREVAESDKQSWEQRGLEVERVLASVRDEVVKAEAERETLETRVDEAEHKVEQAESRNLELAGRLANASGDGADQVDIQELVQQQLDVKIEGVSRELHAVYKKKHETKVATLKKSYEARAEKKHAELQVQLDDLKKENEELRTAKDETFSGQIGLLEKAKALEQCRVQVREQAAAMAELKDDLQAHQDAQDRLRRELDMERQEKGELVAAVDEMLSLQAAEQVPAAVVEDFRKSLSRGSVRPPLPGLPADVASAAKNSRPSGLMRPGIGKSKIMSNIERMGGARADS